MAHLTSSVLKEHQPLVKRLAKQLMTRLPSSVEIDDLIQAGMIGLHDATLRYDPSQNAQFVTFAITRIRGAMLDELRRSDWMSRHTRTKMRAVEKTTRQLEHQLGRPPVELEIAEALHLTLEEFQELKTKFLGGEVSFDDLVSDDDSESDYLDRNTVFDATDTTFESFCDQEAIKVILDEIKKLPDRQREIIMLRLDDVSMREIGLKFQISESRVCQIVEQTVKQLRRKLLKATGEYDESEYRAAESTSSRSSRWGPY
jgi:RNA polymerase sigma factor for flagellar operon FliA